MSPRGFIQFDWRGYPGWDVTPATGRLQYDTFEIRRARVGIDGRWYRVGYELSLGPEELGADQTIVKDAYVQVRFNRAVRVRAGQFKLPGSREYGIAARTLDFMERPAFADSIVTGRDIGASVYGELGKSIEYEGGLFAGDGNGRQSRAGLTFAGRVTWDIARDLSMGGSTSVSDVNVVDTDPANSLDGRAPSGYRFFERVYVQGQRARLGADAAWTPRQWRFAAEVLHLTDERIEQGVDVDDLPSLVSLGWSASVLRHFGRRGGAARSRLREWDLGLRFDSLTFDDDGPETGRDSVRPRASDIRARGADTLTVTASWRPLQWMRVLASSNAEYYSEPTTAPEAGKQGVYWTFGTRLQLELP